MHPSEQAILPLKDICRDLYSFFNLQYEGMLPKRHKAEHKMF